MQLKNTGISTAMLGKPLTSHIPENPTVVKQLTLTPCQTINGMNLYQPLN